jgi:hypothetical protein
MTWSGLIRPPRLQHSETDAGTQRTATWLELFFDLAFVLVVGELAVGLRNDLTFHGALVFAGLFTSVWWAWAGFTFYANRFDTDDLVYRLAKLAAMLAVAGLAASATDATGRRHDHDPSGTRRGWEWIVLPRMAVPLPDDQPAGGEGGNRPAAGRCQGGARRAGPGTPRPRRSSARGAQRRLPGAPRRLGARTRRRRAGRLVPTCLPPSGRCRPW